MCDHLDQAERRLDRRTLLVGTAATLAGAGLGRALASPPAAAAHQAPAEVAAAPARKPTGPGPVVQTVAGPVGGDAIRWALGHEHLFVDFLGPASAEYMDVNWADVAGACVNSALELRAQGVDLLVDWTCLGVGRNVWLLRDVSRRSGLHIVCPTGIYKSLVPPQFATSSIDELAAHFYGELASGIDGGPIRAGWIKIATTESGPTATDTKIHRAAARAGKRAGCTISLHSPFADATDAVVRTLESEGFDLGRFVWGHSQPSPSAAHIALARRGAMVQFDAISADSDPFFNGPTDDESMLDRIEAMVAAGFGDRAIVSADASVFVNPAKFQYDRDATYVYRTFVPKLQARIGQSAARVVLRDNVLKAFRRGSAFK